MGSDRIDERVRQRQADHELIRSAEGAELAQIDQLRDQSLANATVRRNDSTRAQDAATIRQNETRTSESIRPDAPKTDGAAEPERPGEKPAEFRTADGRRDLQDLMKGRLQPKAPPPEARIRQAETRPETRAPRPAAETARPSDATRIAQNRAVQGRREATIAERPRNDQLPRDPTHLRSNNQKPLTTAQKQNLAARMRAYVANLFKPKGPSSPAGSQARQLQASVAQKKATAGLPLSQTGQLPKGSSSTTPGSASQASRGGTLDTKEKGPVIEAGKLIAYDGQSGDPEALARQADTRDAFYRLGAGESPLVFDQTAWHEVQQERSQPVQVRHANNGGADHQRVAALRGRQRNA